MRIFVVSLKDSIDRQKSIITQCDRLNIEPIFIDAINGKNLSQAKISQYCNQKKAKQLFNRELLLGEIGCALSHKKIYKKIVDENIPYAVILEDDAVVEKKFNEVIKLILNLDVNWELVLLGHHKNANKGLSSPLSVWGRNRINSKSTLNYLADFGFGTYGYIISLEGARKLEIELDNIYKPIDHYTSDSSIINVYALHPTVINVNEEFHTLIDDSKTRKNSNDRLSVLLLKKIGIINIAVRLKIFIKVLKPIRKYK
jgi:glycosyl transferase family 25